jgi:4-amino-4-deoxy-L-arabinose transferase-like glycosyltransferase
MLLVLGAALNVWFLINHCPFDLSGDEAHYWEWSRHLDISYYSKGPLVAYIIAAGRFAFGDLSRQLVGNESLAVRVPAIILSIFTGLGLYVLALRTTRRPAIALAAVAITATIPIASAGSMLMTIDAPLACCWVWALVCVHAALESGSLRAWLACGVLIAIGTLAKYTMVLLFPVVGLVLLLDPDCRRHLRRPGPYLATLFGLLGWLPILAWNAQHQWVSFRHVAGQAGVSGGIKFNPAGIAEYIGGQAAVIGPWVIGMWLAVWAVKKRPPGQVEWPMRLLALAAAVPWLFFLAFSPITKVQPNWPMTALPPATILLCVWLSRTLHAAPQIRRRSIAYIATCVVFGIAAAVLIRHTEWLVPLFKKLSANAPPWELTPIARYDPTARLRGWSDLGQAVGEVLHEQRASGRDPFILADDYQTASQLAFYTRENPATYCAQSALGGRLSQYDLWSSPISDPQSFIGRPVVYIGSSNPILTGEHVGHAALPGMQRVRLIEHRLAGEPMQIWSIFVCDSFAGFKSPTEHRKY